MSGIGQTQHLDTGLQAIDCVVYRHIPATVSLAPKERNMTLYRIIDYGPEKTASADRPADDHVLLLLTRGSGKMCKGKLAGERFISEGSRDLRVSFVPQGADASIEFGNTAKSINLLFPNGLLDDLAAEHTRSAKRPMLFKSNDALAGLISLIELEMFRPGLVADMVADQAMRSIALILSGTDPNGFLSQGDRMAIAPARLRRVIDFIAANLDQRLTIGMLAEVAGLSVFHFARSFRMATGLSPYRYTLEQRLFLAQRLLMDRNLPISEIARACGYPRHSQFSNAFTSARGLPPRAFRKHFAM